MAQVRRTSAGMTNLNYLYLYNNSISDISPLARMTQLNYLHLHNNSISDISTLVSNSGINSGDVVYIFDNPLDCDDAATQGCIATIEERGVELHHDCR